MVLAGEATPSRVELPLLKAVARAHRWALELISGQVNSVDEIARREHMDKRSVRRLLRLGFLSPRIIEAIGRRPPAARSHGLQSHPSGRSAAALECAGAGARPPLIHLLHSGILFTQAIDVVMHRTALTIRVIVINWFRTNRAPSIDGSVILFRWTRIET
jgi:hypothetical protein